jgi:hypothetical protein
MSLRIEKRGGTQALICACCNLPFARVQFGRLVIQSKHYSDAHTNALTLDDLKELVTVLEGNDGIMSEVHERASA